jgi:RNA polymerase sigma-70 factor, ECF subfamily
MNRYFSISIDELVRLCSESGEEAAWEEFVRRFHRLIATVVLRLASRLGDSSKETVDDLIQETYLKLCAKQFRVLRNFEQRHPDAFIGYIKVVAANVVRDHFKISRSEKRGLNKATETPEDFVAVAGENALGGPKSMERIVLMRQVERYLEDCLSGEDRDRNARIFWLYYRAGLSAGAIASLPGTSLTTKGVESLIFRITKELRERMVDAKRGPGQNTQDASEGILPAESF